MGKGAVTVLSINDEKIDLHLKNIFEEGMMVDFAFIIFRKIKTI